MKFYYLLFKKKLQLQYLQKRTYTIYQMKKKNKKQGTLEKFYTLKQYKEVVDWLILYICFYLHNNSNFLIESKNYYKQNFALRNTI